MNENQFAECLISFNAALRFHAANFQILHWNAFGEDFDDAHVNIAENYYNLCLSFVDGTAEMITRLGYYAPGYREVNDIAINNGWHISETYRLYSRADVIAHSDAILCELVMLVNGCLSCEGADEISNVGIRSELETISNELDLQYRYINRRRTI